MGGGYCREAGCGRALGLCHGPGEPALPFRVVGRSSSASLATLTSLHIWRLPEERCPDVSFCAALSWSRKSRFRLEGSPGCFSEYHIHLDP